jgi:TP901 family phage tail tape measure protein
VTERTVRTRLILDVAAHNAAAREAGRSMTVVEQAAAAAAAAETRLEVAARVTAASDERLASSARLVAEAHRQAATASGADAEATRRAAAVQQQAAAAQLSRTDMIRLQEQALAENAARDTAAAEAARRTAAAQREAEAAERRRTSAMQESGSAATKAGAALFAGFAVGAYAAAKFDSAMSEVKANTGATGASFKSLSDTALKAGKDTVFSATEAAQGEDELAKAGVSVKNIIGGGLVGALNLASAGQMSVADAAETAASAMTLFGLSGKDVPHVADVLSAGANKAQGSVHDLSMGMAQGGPIAAQFGLSLEDTVGALAQFASHGIMGSDAGTSLKSMLLALASATDKQKNAMADLGLQFYDSTGKFVGLSAMAGQLQDKLGGLTDHERQTALATIFGSDAIRVASILYADGAAKTDGWRRAVDDAGNASRTSATKLNNLSGDMTAFGGTIETALIQQGQHAQPVLRAITQAANAMVGQFLALPAPVQAGASGLLAVSGGALLVVGAMATMVPKIQAMRTALLEMGVAGRIASASLSAIGIGAGIGIVLVGLAEVANAISHRLSQDSKAAKVDVAALATQLTELGKNGRIAGEALKVLGPGANKAASEIKLLTSNLGGADSVKTKLLPAIKGIDAALAQMVQSGHTEEAGKAFDRITAAAERQHVPMDKLTKLFPAYAEAAKQADENSGQLADGSLNAIGKQAADTGADVSDLADQMKRLSDSVDALNAPFLDADQALVAYKGKVADLAASLKANGRTWDVNTEAGRKNRAALDDAAQSAIQLAQKQAALSGNTDDLRTSMEASRVELVRTLVQMGYNQSEAQALARQYLQIPTSLYTNTTTNAVATRQQVQDYINTLYSIPARRETQLILKEQGFSAQARRVYTDPAYAQATGGINVRSFAGGGFSRLPSSPMIAPAGTLYQWAEPSTMGEAFIPLSPATRRASQGTLGQVARMIGGTYSPPGSGSGGGHGGDAIVAEVRALRAAVSALADRPATFTGNIVTPDKRRLATFVSEGQKLNNRRGGSS